MNIICNKNSLIKSVNTVIRAVSQKTTMPILQCILLKAENGVFSLTGNDLELGVYCTSAATVRKEGSVAVNAKIFSEIIRRLPEDEVIIDSDDKDNITITSGKSKFNIPGQRGADFPLLPEVQSENQMVLPQNEFRQMVQKTIFSIAQEDSGRPVLTGELIDVRDGYLYIVAVDGFRISMQRTDISGDKRFKMTVPGKALNELVKILSSEEDALMNVTFTGRHILFKMDDTLLVSRLLEGEFLNYERNLSISFSTRALVDKKNLLDSIDRAALISKEGKNSPVRFDIRTDKIVITSNTEAGSAYEEVPIRLDGEGMVTAFNPKYYMDALRAIDDDTVCILYSSSLSPCIIQSASGEDYKYFILPIRLN
ncbi:MAG: DNA polymerase III subunit beta [Firmicutes bacterium]|nr:DNA polymerase III subunit beta [Bacillota bacterium]